MKKMKTSNVSFISFVVLLISLVRIFPKIFILAFIILAILIGFSIKYMKFMSKIKISKKATKLYDTQLVGLLEKYGISTKREIILHVINFTFVLIYIGLLSYYKLDFGVPLLIASICSIITTRWWTELDISKLNDRFKYEVINKVVKSANKDLEYSPNKSIPKEEFIKSGLYEEKIYEYKGEDLIEGVIGETKLQFSELIVKGLGQETETKDAYIVYNGPFFILDFNKNFKTNVIVYPDSYGKKEGGFRKKEITKNGKVYQNIKLEDPIFENYFEVYGEDQVESRYILSIKLMEQISNLRELISQDITISFSENKMYISVKSIFDMFETLYFMVPNKKLKLKYLSYNLDFLEIIFNIVEILDLNVRIWSKESETVEKLDTDIV